MNYKINVSAPILVEDYFTSRMASVMPDHSKNNSTTRDSTVRLGKLSCSVVINFFKAFESLQQDKPYEGIPMGATFNKCYLAITCGNSKAFFFYSNLGL